MCNNGHSSFILKKRNELYACGNNAYGQLGLGDAINRSTFTRVNINSIKQVACGFSHTFVLKMNGELYACGDNQYGQLGLGNNNTYTSLTYVCNNVKEVYCGYYHSFIIKYDGTLWGAGWNNNGQLGIANYNNVNVFSQVTTMNPSMISVNNIKNIDCGRHCSIILCKDGSMYGCGSMDKGNVGFHYNHSRNRRIFEQYTSLSNINYDVTQVSCGDVQNAAILKRDGTVWAAGYDHFGELGPNLDYEQCPWANTGYSNIKAVGSGDQFILVLDNNGCLYGSGWSGHGEVCRTTYDVREFCVGSNHTMIIKNDGGVYTCGYNELGQLGIGTADSGVHADFVYTGINVDY